ncbi:MAG: hypothetical protein H0V79_05305 [Actinobacteria bacterium]|nr:hypothetical protein [Actinomycetota bacterium]
MAGAGQRRVQGAFFLLLAVFFAGIAAAGGAAARDGEPGLWVVAVAAAAIAFWFLGVAAKAFRVSRG